MSYDRSTAVRNAVRCNGHALFAAVAQATAPLQRCRSAPIWLAVEAAGWPVTDVTAAGRPIMLVLWVRSDPT